MRLVYVTSSFPYGRGEGFLVAELQELRRQGNEVTIVPTLARGPIVHDDARPLLSASMRSPLFSRDVISAAWRGTTSQPSQSLELLLQLGHSRSPAILAKNASVFLKGFWLARRVQELGADHIHAHWAGTSATLAMIASRLSAVPWSLTVHRWDIRENNLLKTKADSAAFVRAVSHDGLIDVERTIGATRTPMHLIHMGVPRASRPLAPVERDGAEGAFRILVPANFLEVKGHRYLVEAIRLLSSRGTRVVAALAGDGPLRSEIVAQIAASGLAEECVIAGQVSHSDVLRQLAGGCWDVVALASVETPSGEKEGIPVSFLEAMSYGVPVVGTAVGGIPELLGDGAGLLVPPRDALALANAFARLADDVELRTRLGTLGRERVERDFSVEAVVRELVRLFDASKR